MQYEKPTIEVEEVLADDIICISNGGYDDDDGDFSNDYGKFI